MNRRSWVQIVKSYWISFWKSYFYQKIFLYIHTCNMLLHFSSSNYSSWFKKLYSGVISQYGDLNILWNCLYRWTFLYIIIAQWSRALVLWIADPEFKSAGDFCLKLLNKFLKVIFLPKVIFPLLFVHSYLSYVTSSSNHSSRFKKLYSGMMCHLNFMNEQMHICDCHLQLKIQQLNCKADPNTNLFYKFIHCWIYIFR